MTISANLHHDPLAPVQKELDQFNGLADVWWDASGPMWPLHKLNHLELLHLLTEHLNQELVKVLMAPIIEQRLLQFKL